MNQYKIAGLNLAFQGIEYDYFFRRMKEYSVSCNETADVNITYCDNDNIILPKGKVYKKTGYWSWIESEDKKYVAYQKHTFSERIKSLITADRDWKNVSLKLLNFTNDFYVTNEYRSFTSSGEIFAYSLLKHNGIVLHSSAIDYKNNAILFSAPSGTGKSTHASLWKKYYNETVIFNDDSPAIRYINDKLYAFGTPWSGKTEINRNCSIPLRAIVFLEQAGENRIKQIKGKEAVSLMLNETRKPVFPELMDLSLDIINKVINSIPIYLLSCDISRNAVDLVKNTLEV